LVEFRCPYCSTRWKSPPESNASPM
jgi:hypothetical protein